MSSGRKTDKETWWWKEDMQEYIQRKRLAKKWDTERTYDDWYTRLDRKERETDLYRLVRQRKRHGKDMQQTRVIKDRDGNVVTDSRSVTGSWKEYFE